MLVAGYLVHRLGQLGWSPWKAVGASAILRGSYHLYQGLGGFVGNVVMGLLFARLYQRWGRVMPLIIAHTIIDSVAFVGYIAAQGPRLVDLSLPPWTLTGSGYPTGRVRPQPLPCER